jgi:hypothetical protein
VWGGTLGGRNRTRLEDYLKVVDLEAIDMKVVNLEAVDREACVMEADTLFIGSLVIVGMLRIQ